MYKIENNSQSPIFSKPNQEIHPRVTFPVNSMYARTHTIQYNLGQSTACPLDFSQGISSLQDAGYYSFWVLHPADSLELLHSPSETREFRKQKTSTYKYFLNKALIICAIIVVFWYIYFFVPIVKTNLLYQQYYFRITDVSDGWLGMLKTIGSRVIQILLNEVRSWPTMD